MEQLKVDEEIAVEIKEISSESTKPSDLAVASDAGVPAESGDAVSAPAKSSSQIKKAKKKIKDKLKNSKSKKSKAVVLSKVDKHNKKGKVVRSNKPKKSDKSKKSDKIEKLDSTTKPIKTAKPSEVDKSSEVAIVDKTLIEAESSEESAVPLKRAPEYESSVGFPPGSRRPIKDPFRVGEKITMIVSYFKAKAGEMTLEVRPFVEVNGQKSYRWYTSLKTVGVFSSFYSVDDWSETMANFESLVPNVFTLNVRESSQLKQAKGYFDNKTLKAKYYEKKYTEKKGQEEKRQEWLTLPFSQNVFSAAFYMRIFTYEVGKEYVFNVADDEKNVLFKAKCLRKEKIELQAGVFDTIVIRPNFEINGVFKPMGEILFWLSDDDRKLLLRIESDIKIGTIVAEALSVERGHD